MFLSVNFISYTSMEKDFSVWISKAHSLVAHSNSISYPVFEQSDGQTIDKNLLAVWDWTGFFSWDNSLATG